MSVCPQCNGTGNGKHDPIEGTLTCENCNGTGVLWSGALNARTVIGRERQALITALSVLSIQRETFEAASRKAEIDRVLWSQKDVLSGRIRAQCVKELEQTVIGQDKFGADKLMSATAAQTAASDHPTYTYFKDELAELTQNKDWAAAQAVVELQRLECAKLDVEAKIELLRTARIAPDAFTLVNDSPSTLETQLRESVEAAAS